MLVSQFNVIEDVLNRRTAKLDLDRSKAIYSESDFKISETLSPKEGHEAKVS